VGLKDEADRFRWFHRIDLGDGVLTNAPGPLPWGPQHFPSVAGRSVLDIGAWDGGYSFMVEREGAARVVALDHYAWGVDMDARDVYWRACAERGELPDHNRDERDFWRADLPGKGAFDLAHRVYGSNVEAMVADFTSCDLADVGTFDVVLYLGVLYHMPEPLTCLRRVRAVTRDVAAIASVAIDLPDHNDEYLLRFSAGDEVNDDFGNWYLPTISALTAMCRAAGFARTETVVGPPNVPGRFLAMVHAFTR